MDPREKKLPVSRRLRACETQIRPGARVADIGCDHGYLAIELLRTGRASFVHASDLREQPIKKAMANALRFGVADKIRFTQADGLRAVDPKEVDTIVCAGMGGDLIAEILDAAPWVKHKKYRLILQPQSSGNDLRRKLSEDGFHIEKEVLVEDGGFLYQVLVVRYGHPEHLSPGQQYVCPRLIEAKDPLLEKYIERIDHALELTVEGIRRARDPEAAEKLSYYETAWREVREMRENYDKDQRHL